MERVNKMKQLQTGSVPLWSLFSELSKEAVHDMLYEDLDKMEQQTDKD